MSNSEQVPYLNVGEQFWNGGDTEGVEVVEPCYSHTPVMAKAFIPLGDMVEMNPGHQMPLWLAKIIIDPDGLKAYRERNNITKP